MEIGGGFVTIVDATQLNRVLRGLRQSHAVSRLAAPGDAGERKILGRVPPHDVAFLPRHAENFRARAVHVNHRLRSQIADSRLKDDTAFGRDDQKPVEPDRASNITTQRHSDAANFRAHPLRSSRHPLAPSELFCTAIECFFEECAGGVAPFSLHRWSEWSLALGAV